MSATQDYLKMVVKLYPKHHIPVPYVYLLDKGQAWATGRPARDLGPAQACYHNALTLARRTPLYRYVEGMAVASGVGIPVNHAWVVDENNQVVETTWEAGGADYFGIVVPTKTVVACLKLAGAYSVLECWWKWPEIYKLLTGGGDESGDLRAGVNARQAGR